jgi:hypothetical protein
MPAQYVYGSMFFIKPNTTLVMNVVCKVPLKNTMFVKFKLLMEEMTQEYGMLPIYYRYCGRIVAYFFFRGHTKMKKDATGIERSTK